MSFLLNQYDKIHYYTNAILNCNKIIEFIEETDSSMSDQTVLPKWKEWKSGSGDYVYGKQKREIVENIKNGPEDMVSILNQIRTSIENVSYHYKNIHNIEIGQLMPLAISKYFTEKSMGPHVDFYGGVGPQPAISVIAYLNDDYKGGEIEFRDQNIKIKPEAGSIVIFPSKEPYYHASLPITSGIKYMAPGFWYIYT